MCGLKEDRCCEAQYICLLAACVFGDSLGSFGNGMLRQFTGQEETYSSLDFPRRDSLLLVLQRQTGSFRCYAFEDVVDERVHDAHGFAGNTDIGVNLFQYVVDVDTVGFLSLSLAFLLSCASDLTTFL